MKMEFERFAPTKLAPANCATEKLMKSSFSREKSTPTRFEYWHVVVLIHAISRTVVVVVGMVVVVVDSTVVVVAGASAIVVVGCGSSTMLVAGAGGTVEFDAVRLSAQLATTTPSAAMIAKNRRVISLRLWQMSLAVVTPWMRNLPPH
jgi:hypothetical protein